MIVTTDGCDLNVIDSSISHSSSQASFCKIIPGRIIYKRLSSFQLFFLSPDFIAVKYSQCDSPKSALSRLPTWTTTVVSFRKQQRFNGAQLD